MSAGATPSDLMSETSALAAFAFAAMASPAVFSVFVTPRAKRAKSGAALTLPSPVTSTQRSSAAAGVAASVVRIVMQANLRLMGSSLDGNECGEGCGPEHGASPLIGFGRLGSECARRLET